MTICSDSQAGIEANGLTGSHTCWSWFVETAMEWLCKTYQVDMVWMSSVLERGGFEEAAGLDNGGTGTIMNLVGPAVGIPLQSFRRRKTI